MADYEEVTKILGVTAAAYPNFKLRKETIDVYAQDLADVDADVLAAAATQCRRECEFFPTLTALNKKVEAIMRLARGGTHDAAEAWCQVCAAIRFNERGVGYWQNKDACDPIAVLAANAFGLTRIAVRLEENAGTDFAQFRDTYNSFSNRQAEIERLHPAVLEQIEQLAGRLNMARRLKEGTHGSNGQSNPDGGNGDGMAR